MGRQSLYARDAEYVVLLKDCTFAKNLHAGARVHADLLKSGSLDTNLLACDALVRMYAKGGALLKANELLAGLHVQNVSSWNAVIATFIQQCQCQNALECYEKMRHEGISPNTITFAFVLKACARLRDIEKGVQVQDDIIKQGLLESDIVLGSALVDMYAKCGALARARELLDKLPKRNVFSWTALIHGLAAHGNGLEALTCFEQMQHEGLSPDSVTFVALLKACASIKAIEKGVEFHEEIAKRGLLKNNGVLLSSLIDMYAKCGILAKARRLLDGQVGGVIAWTALIDGYAEQGDGWEALECFQEMRTKGISPNTLTFASVLKACGSLGATDKGEQIHEEISRQGLLENDNLLGSALLDMYSKCGALHRAQQVHDQLPTDDVISWTMLLAGYALHGCCRDVLSCFEQMRLMGVTPTALTLTCILNACSHSGLIDEGHIYFASIHSTYGLQPASEHYTCMVDLLGRAGHLDKAVTVIKDMPPGEYLHLFRSLLRACQNQQDVEIGRWAFNKGLQVDKNNLALFDLMSNIQVGAGKEAYLETCEAMAAEDEVLSSHG